MSKTPKPPGWSQLQKEVLDSPFPMLFGAPYIVDGYCSLEQAERGIAMETLSRHTREVSLWYRGLKLFLDPFNGEWPLPDEEPAKELFRLQVDILGLELSSAKVGLDTTLAGYYSMAFAAIRHMLEAATQITYMRVVSAETAPWDVDAKVPRVRVMVNEIKRDLKKSGSSADEAELFEKLYESWALMSKGSHPTGVGLMQLWPTPEDPRRVVGSSYRQNFAYVAFDCGLWALQMLLMAMPVRVGTPWADDFNRWTNDRLAWNREVKGREELHYLWEQEAEATKEAVAKDADGKQM